MSPALFPDENLSLNAFGIEASHCMDCVSSVSQKESVYIDKFVKSWFVLFRGLYHEARLAGYPDKLQLI